MIGSVLLVSTNLSAIAQPAVLVSAALWFITVVIAKVLRMSHSIHISPTVIICPTLNRFFRSSYKAIANRKFEMVIQLAWPADHDCMVELMTSDGIALPMTKAISFKKGTNFVKFDVIPGNCTGVTDVTVSAALEGAPTTAVITVYPC